MEAKGMSPMKGFTHLSKQFPHDFAVAGLTGLRFLA
jgi:hypothetical protein